MKISYIWEHNGDDTLVYAENYIGAYTRGISLSKALGKMEKEIMSYVQWSGMDELTDFELEMTKDRPSVLNICDADSDVLFESEKKSLTMEEYESLKSLALKSARDFQALYEAIPDKNKSVLSERKTFYGQVPRTAFEMYEHTKNVNAYYFAEIGVEADNDGDIVECREKGFALLEQKPDYLSNPVIEGSFGEEWSLRKVIRRFVWHDRIHAKAMWRMAGRTFKGIEIPNYFYFEN